ncbi:MAG TPA: HNH endonuclease signature motif containing protein [Nocardioides sp.]|jgi:hypothetical protein|nr:HNH endonuclease signature motif containing protein [Nocardioides sp.]
MGNSGSATHLRPDTPADVLAVARNRRRAADAAEVDLLHLAVDWALMHPAESIEESETRRLRGFGDTDLAIAGPGAPTVAEFSLAEFATTIGMGTEAGKCYVGEALELCYRLPRLWDRVVVGDLPAWKARMVARETIRLTKQAAAFVDQHLAATAHKVRPAELDRLVNEAIGRFMPEEVERLAAQSWDKRHLTVFDQLVSFTGTMAVAAELDIADALDLEAAVAAGAEQRAAWGSTQPLDVRRAQAVGDLARGQAPLDLIPDNQLADQTADQRADQRADQTATPSVPRVQPRQVVLFAHLSQTALTGPGCEDLDPVARLERGNSLIGVEQVRAWCGAPSTTQIMVQPVIDIDQCLESDSDQVPAQIAERVALRDHTCVFPWCTRPARRCHPDQPHQSGGSQDHPCDCDHVHPRGRGGPTCTCNLAPLCRRHHRLKTHSPWTYTVLDPGTYLWTSPHGYQLLRDPTGTIDVTPDRPRPPALDKTDPRRTP